jgi:hypothetical protein
MAAKNVGEQARDASSSRGVAICGKGEIAGAVARPQSGDCRESAQAKIRALKVGDEVLISGVVFTGRKAALRMLKFGVFV